MIPVNAPEGATELQAIEFAAKTWKPTATTQPAQPQEVVAQERAPFEEYVRPALEFGGMLAGGATGAVAGPAGSIAGGGLGYAAGKNIADLIYAEQGTLPQELAKTGKDVVQGAAMEAGGQVLGKALPALATAVGKGSVNVLGKLTGTGTAAVENALASGTKTGITINPLKSSTAFDKALRGEITGQEITTHATDALSKLKDVRGAEYMERLDRIKLDQNIQNKIVTNVTKKVNDLIGKDQFDITPVFDKNGKIANFDFSESTLVENQPVIAKALKDMLTWKNQTAAGLDILKKRLNQYAGQVSPGTPQEAFLNKLENAVSSELKAEIPQYAEMTKGYSEATNLIKDLESGLMLRKQGMSGRIVADQQLRRLTSAMQDNFALRRDLVQVLGGKGTDIEGEVAGYAMNSLTPRGLAGSGPALVGSGALAMVSPKMWPVLAASSPRVTAEFLRMFGKGLAEVSGVGPLVGKGAAYTTNALSTR
jgi:hypothetical protein